MLQRQRRNRIVDERGMKTLTSCELLRVTDGCVVHAGIADAAKK